jgi:hypothetical protein
MELGAQGTRHKGIAILARRAEKMRKAKNTIKQFNDLNGLNDLSNGQLTKKAPGLKNTEAF